MGKVDEVVSKYEQYLNKQVGYHDTAKTGLVFPVTIKNVSHAYGRVKVTIYSELEPHKSFTTDSSLVQLELGN